MVKWGTMATSFGLEYLGWMLGKPSLLGERYSTPPSHPRCTLPQPVGDFLSLEFSKSDLHEARAFPSDIPVFWNLHRCEHPKVDASLDHVLPVNLAHVVLLMKWLTLCEGQDYRRNSCSQAIPQMTGSHIAQKRRGGEDTSEATVAVSGV